MKNMTPERFRCAPLHCPCVHELADKRLLIVGSVGYPMACRHGISVGLDETAVIINRDLLEDVFKAWLVERSAMVADAWE